MAVVAPSAEEAVSVIGAPPPLSKPAVAYPSGAFPGAAGPLHWLREFACAAARFGFPRTRGTLCGMGHDLYESFPVIKEWMDRAAAAADFDLLHLLFNDREENLQKTRWQQPALFAMEHAMAPTPPRSWYSPCGYGRPQYGELACLCLAGSIP